MTEKKLKIIFIAYKMKILFKLMKNKINITIKLFLKHILIKFCKIKITYIKNS